MSARVFLSLRTPLLLVGVLSFLPTSQAAIFGADDRVLVTPASQEYELARSTAVAVLSSNWEETSPGRIRIDTEASSSWLCKDQKFSDSRSLSYACSGFLVAPDLLVTAGHCMVNVGETRNEQEMYCGVYSWLFDYNTSVDGKVQLEEIPADRHYRCKQIIYAVNDGQAPFRDYALVQLDRPVEGRKPFKLSTEKLGVRTPLRMIGHPLGLPSVLSKSDRIFVNKADRGSFITNLDAFEGNSGSGVFNAKNEIVGILIGGTPSDGLIDVPGQSCSKYNVCDSSARNCTKPDKDESQFPHFQHVGSEVQRIAPIVELIKAFEATRGK